MWPWPSKRETGAGWQHLALLCSNMKELLLDIWPRPAFPLSHRPRICRLRTHTVYSCLSWQEDSLAHQQAEAVLLASFLVLTERPPSRHPQRVPMGRSETRIFPAYLGSDAYKPEEEQDRSAP